MNKKAVCAVLNQLKVIETNGGDDAYILVDDNDFNREQLRDVGVLDSDIDAASDYGKFCLLSLAFNCGTQYADEYEGGKFIAWEELVDDDLRYRVLNGEGTGIDAERLLKALEPGLFK